MCYDACMMRNAIKVTVRNTDFLFCWATDEGNPLPETEYAEWAAAYGGDCQNGLPDSALGVTEVTLPDRATRREAEADLMMFPKGCKGRVVECANECANYDGNPLDSFRTFTSYSVYFSASHTNKTTGDVNEAGVKRMTKVLDLLRAGVAA